MYQEGNVSLRTQEASCLEPSQILPYACLSVAGSDLYPFIIIKLIIKDFSEFCESFQWILKPKRSHEKP